MIEFLFVFERVLNQICTQLFGNFNARIWIQIFGIFILVLMSLFIKFSKFHPPHQTFCYTLLASYIQ